MRILQITSSFPRWEEDYAGLFILQSAIALKGRGMEVEVIAPGAPGVPKNDVLKGIPVHRFTYVFPSGVQKLAYGGGILSNLKISWIARFEILPFFFTLFLKTLQLAKRFDVLHAHWIPTSLPVLLIARLVRKPIVLTVHETDPYHLTFLKTIYAFLLQKTDLVVCVSQAMKIEVLEMGVSSRKIAVVPNGVEVEEEVSSKSIESKDLKLQDSKDTQDFNLLWIGRMVEKKGIIHLIVGMKTIVKEFPQVSLTLVGDGVLRKELEIKSTSLGLQDHIRFEGEHHHREIPQFFEKSTLFVLPSLREPFGVVLLEAMAAGRAVVASRVGGITDIVLQDKTGILVPPKDPEALANAVIHLLKNKSLRKEMGREGERRVLEHYTWEKVAHQMEEVYKGLLNG
jgi:glycosyltransferase involved in cell wall biosynthesis